MITERTYPRWQDLAMSEELSGEARSTERWKALGAAMTLGHDEEIASLGQLLDSLDQAPARRHTS